MADFTTLESLYARGVLDINGKDFINGTNSNIPVNPQREEFLPDSRFVRIDGPYMRDRVDRYTYMQQSGVGRNTMRSALDRDVYEQNNVQRPRTAKDKIKDVDTASEALAIVGLSAMFFSGRYILKKLHFIK